MYYTTPFISICIPVYNVENYLDYCIKSLLAQTYKNFEVILVDDGSKDMSGKLCDRYALQYPSIFKVIHQNNQGLYAARKAAFRKASGKYCICVDSDDAIAPDALEVITQAIKNTGADVIFYDWSSFPDFRPDGHSIAFEGQSAFIRPIEYDIATRKLLSSRALNNMWLKAFSASLLPIILDDKRCQRLQYGEDLYATLALFYGASKFAYVAKPLYYYRQRDSSLTHTFERSRFSDIVFVRNAVRIFAETTIEGEKLEAALVDVSRIDLMQVVDLAEMVCLSKDNDKGLLLEEIRSSDLFGLANATNRARGGLRVDYALQLFLLRIRAYRLLNLTVHAIQAVKPAVRFAGRQMISAAKQRKMKRLNSGEE